MKKEKLIVIKIRHNGVPYRNNRYTSLLATGATHHYVLVRVPITGVLIL